MKNPYRVQPPKAFWKRSVADRNPFDLIDLYHKEFDITATDRIVAAGSCFAQHLGRRLKKAGFRYRDFEPAPRLLPAAIRKLYGYGIYSARYGNIYTARQLIQLYKRSIGTLVPVDQDWETEGRFYDAFRPTVEPNGFASLDEMHASRAHHLMAVRNLFHRADLVVFTFGLTEGWVSTKDGVTYPMCPGTAAGTYDADKYSFCNFTCADIVSDMTWFIDTLRRLNPEIKFIFTVSPVPLVATATNQHALVATTYSKSVLRAACGELAQLDGVAYFPSYEIITAPAMRGIFYEPDMREVNEAGVEYVMSHFFKAHPPINASPPVDEPSDRPEVDDDFVVCDEIMLEGELHA